MLSTLMGRPWGEFTVEGGGRWKSRWPVGSLHSAVIVPGKEVASG